MRNCFGKNLGVCNSKLLIDFFSEAQYSKLLEAANSLTT